MAGGQNRVQVSAVELIEKLNHLVYVVESTKKVVTSFKNDLLKDQTKDFLDLMETVRDAIYTYQDEVADQVDME